MVASRLGWLAAVATIVVTAAGPFDIELLNTPKAPAAQGTARLVYAPSPFGIAVTADGRASYDVEIQATGLPEPSTLGAYSAYVAWEANTELTAWRRLGTVKNGASLVGHAELNKFLLVITAEPSAEAAVHAGPTVLHGTSPSGWLQTFLSHPLFRGVPP
ncbi:MAG: hypothetical protein ABIY52_08595 [Gemmatimonadaceae bacterium]